MYRVLGVDEQKNSAEILYNGEKYTIWRDWHEGHYKCWDKKGNSYFIGEYKNLNKYKTCREIYNSEEFKNGFIKDRERDEIYIRERKTVMKNQSAPHSYSKPLVIGGGIAVAALAAYNYLKKK